MLERDLAIFHPFLDHTEAEILTFSVHHKFIAENPHLFQVESRKSIRSSYYDGFTIRKTRINNKKKSMCSREGAVRNHDIHNGMILSTLSISSHGFAFGFPKRPRTNGNVFFTYKLMINPLIS